MARHESDREDLLREATALVERIEVAARNVLPDDNLVVGFRREGAASFYFGADPAYHFNPVGELRRAFCDGLLVKAECGRLVSMRRERTDDEVQLHRHDLSDVEQSQFLERMRLLLKSLASALDRGDYSIVGQVPEDRDVVGRVREWLTTNDCSVVAENPFAEG